MDIFWNYTYYVNYIMSGFMKTVLMPTPPAWDFSKKIPGFIIQSSTGSVWTLSQLTKLACVWLVGVRPLSLQAIGPLYDPVTWYGINYTGTQVMQWDFQNKGTCTSLARLSFVLKVPRRNLCPSVIYSVPCDGIVQRAYWLARAVLQPKAAF